MGSCPFEIIKKSAELILWSVCGAVLFKYISFNVQLVDHLWLGVGTLH